MIPTGARAQIATDDFVTYFRIGDPIQVFGGDSCVPLAAADYEYRELGLTKAAFALSRPITDP